MKTIISLLPNQEGKQILDEIKHGDYGDFKFTYHSGSNCINIAFDGNFSIDYKEPYLWIEDQKYYFFRIPTRLITRFYVIGE